MIGSINDITLYQYTNGRAVILGQYNQIRNLKIYFFKNMLWHILEIFNSLLKISLFGGGGKVMDRVFKMLYMMNYIFH